MSDGPGRIRAAAVRRAPAQDDRPGRADGSPRIFGIEAAFEDGELVSGFHAERARKGAQPRFALHFATVGPVAGGRGADGARFRADIAEVVHTRLNEAATKLVVEWWTPGHRGCEGSTATDR